MLLSPNLGSCILSNHEGVNISRLVGQKDRNNSFHLLSIARWEKFGLFSLLHQNGVGKNGW